MNDYDLRRLKRHLDDAEDYLRKARRRRDGSDSDVERYIKRALSEIDDAQRLIR